jgi:predicted adenylyl cyclase CyaB
MAADLAAGADAVDHAADVPSVTYGNHMARNIELKARIESVEAMRTKAAALADQGPIEILQEDTFFTCARGRLKLRAFSAHAGQLIFYQRPNQPGPKASFFITAPTSSPDTLREALSLAYGQAGRVRTHRTLYLVGRTRVHLDRVEELGHFLELEVVLSEGEPSAPGVEEAHTLMAALGIAPTQLIEGAYVDLLAQKHA